MSADPGARGEARRDTLTDGHSTTSGRAGTGRIGCQGQILGPGSPALGDGQEAEGTYRPQYV